MRIPIQFKFKKGKKTQSSFANLPTQWGDLTLGQAVQIIDFDFNMPNAKLKLYSIITGLSKDELNALGEWERFEECMSFLYTTPELSGFSIPDHVDIEGVRCKVPKKLEIESYGQKVAVEELLRNAVVAADGKELNIVGLMPEALAIYFYPIVTGEKFNDERVEEHIQSMMQIPVKYAYPIAAFFLTKYGELSITNDLILPEN